MQRRINRSIIPSTIFKKKINMVESDNRFDLYRTKEGKERVSERKILITMPYGIGDAVYIGLSAVDQVVKNDPERTTQIDVMCNPLQTEIFLYDPRLTSIITVEKDLFPTQDKKTWVRAVFPGKRTRELFAFLQKQNYAAIFPGNMAFTFLHRLGGKVLYPGLRSVAKDFLTIRNYGDAPASRRVRTIINTYYGNNLSEPEIGEEIPLYINPLYVERAKKEVEQVKISSGIDPNEAKIVVVAPDTASGVTRPPTHLFTEGLMPVLRKNPSCIVYILPSFTDIDATQRLFKSLSSYFGDRIQRMPDGPRPSLLYSTALVDQSDVFVTGDTGIMHLAAAFKINPDNCSLKQNNKTRIVALFGGTNPGLYGYHMQTKIIGRGRKDQKYIRPGFLKEGYDPKDRDYFSHVSPQEITKAIESALTSSRRAEKNKDLVIA